MVGMRDADEWFEKGCRAITRNRYRHAERYLSRALAIHPGWHDARQRRALSREHLGKLREAISDYRHALKSDPQCAWCWEYLGDVYVTVGQYRAAHGCLMRAMRLSPRESSLRYDLGEVLLKLGQYRAAIRAFHSIRRSRRFGMLWREGRGRALVLLGKTVLALRDLDACVRMRPDCHETWFYRGIIRLKAHDEEGASKDLAKASKRGRRSPPLDKIGHESLDRLLIG